MRLLHLASVLVLLSACSVTTTSSPTPDNQGTGDDGSTTDPSPTDAPPATDPPPSKSDTGPWGTLTDHGDRRVTVTNLTNPPACDDVCKGVGGKCDSSYAGDDDYRADHASDGQYSSFGGRFYDCSYPEQATLVQGSQTFHLDELSCLCGGAQLENPYVDVTVAKDGLHACSAVCTGYSLGCADGESFATASVTSGTTLKCADVPSGKVDHYRCDCAAKSK